MKTITIRIDDETEDSLGRICEQLLDDAETIRHKKLIINSTYEIHKRDCNNPGECCEAHKKAIRLLDDKERLIDLITKVSVSLSKIGD